MNKVLIIAYHYPPVGVSSGVHRTLKFSQYLPESGWGSIVLTIRPKAYLRVSDHQLGDIPSDVHVERAFGLDTARHLSIMGRYPGWLALPDRWVSWVLGGVFSGIKLIKRKKPSVIFSTYPIATAHLIGFVLHKITGLPWIADFRDSMTEPDYPTDKKQWNIYRWIERKVVKHASYMIFTTPGAIAMYSERYPEIASSKWQLIANGYDDEDFVEAESRITNDLLTDKSHQFSFVHSGVIYPSERDPSHFFAAIAELKSEKKISQDQVRIVLRATGHDDTYAPILKKLGIDDIVLLKPAIGYKDALKEMLLSDALLLLQASSCNHQIPAKLYEYIRARRPVLALTDSAGDTAKVLSEAGIDTIAKLDSKEDIKREFMRFLGLLTKGDAPLAQEKAILRHSRKSKSNDLAKLLDTLI